MACIPTHVREASVPAHPVPPGAPEGEVRAPLERLLAAIVELSGATAAMVRLREGDRRELRVVGSVAIPDSILSDQARVTEQCGVCGTALQCDQPRCSATACHCVLALAGHSALRPDQPVGQVAVVPLHYRGATCGVLNLFLPLDRELPAALAPLLPPLGDMLGLALENARLTRHQLRASLEEERHMLANEVHDSLAQNLYGMRMRAALLREAVRTDDRARAERCLGEIDEALAVAQRRVRELITHFRSPVDPRGLVHAIDEAVDAFQGLGGVELRFDSCVDDLPLSPEQQTQVFQIVHEALANLVKHACARHARLRLTRAGAEDWRISVEDDGVGLDGPGGRGAEHGHFGLNIMRERARRIGGRLEFKRGRRGGTRVVLRFPARWPQAEGRA